MGRTWLRSEEQESFLQEKVFDYPAARLRGRQEKFFADLFESWFKQWSESEVQFPGADHDKLTEQQVTHLRDCIVARKQQLRNYVYWRTDHDRRLKRTTRKEVPTLEELLNGKRAKQGPRKKKLIDVYSRLYYETRMAPEVERRVEATKPPGELKKGKEYHSRRMKIVQQVKKEMWDSESPEVRRQVEEEREKLGVGETTEVEKETGKKNDQLELKRQQREISMLGQTLDHVAKELHSHTGYVMSVLLGGLKPDGTVHAVRLHCGETAEGHDFEESTVDYDDCIVKPWYSFVERVFPPSKRRAQAEFYKRTFKVKEGFVDTNASAPIMTEKWSGDDDGCDDEDDGSGDGNKGDGIIADVDINNLPMSPTTSTTSHTPAASSQSDEASSLNSQSLATGVETLESAHPLTVTMSPGSDHGTEAATGTSQSTFPDLTGTGVSNPVEVSAIVTPPGLFWTFPDADADADADAGVDVDSSTKASFGPMTEELHSGLGENSLFHSADYLSLLYRNSLPSGGLTMANGLDSNSYMWSFTGKALPSTTWSNFVTPPANPVDASATIPRSSSPFGPQSPNCAPLFMQTPPPTSTTPSFTSNAPTTPSDSPPASITLSFNVPTTTSDPAASSGCMNAVNSMAAVLSPNTTHVSTIPLLSPPPMNESTNTRPPSEPILSDAPPSTLLNVSSISEPSKQPSNQSKRGTDKKEKASTKSTAPKKTASMAPLHDMGNTNQARPRRDRKRKLHPDEQFVQEQEEREKRQRKGRERKL
ncbi:hypothetical protein Agabi119p4_2645 [Agaricus bisporus var. burnettii]|uniref:Uncharacterized protein n=1 Tax=Agaricus bisporus var. burnettii TaxID=192524 RepID=A0A8H7KK63_AGABI|nr:hypothetical protein Agabi119p4_2645 [Agaricus bisporus var. burnettii]